MLETSDLILKPAVFEDWESIWNNLWSHPESAKYMLWSPTFTAEEAQDRMRRTISFEALHPNCFLVYEKASGQAIGFAGMEERESGVWEETGIALGPAFTRKGCGTQILCALIQEAKDHLHATRFLYACRSENNASQALRRSFGFEPTFKEDLIDPRNDQPYTLEHFELKL